MLICSSNRSSKISSSNVIDSKLDFYSQFTPTPMSISELIEKGKDNNHTEYSSYKHLLFEVLVRLSHLISEMREFPQELQEQPEYQAVVADYLLTYRQVLDFEDKEPNQEALAQGVELLKVTKERHSNVIPSMAAACMAMKKKYSLDIENGVETSLTKAVQYCLDRLYTSRISLNMLTNQHLMVYGHMATKLPGQVGIIHPQTDVGDVVQHAYLKAKEICEKCYLQAPEVEVKIHNVKSPGEKVMVTHIPAHIYHMTLEVLKNAMQATVEHHWERLDKGLPTIKVLVCQSDRDITIKVSDIGGGVDRATADKMFKYLFTKPPRPSITGESVPLSGYGYGLPLSRLYARYFQGDIKAASYEGHGTDIYIYFQALSEKCVEKLPIWSQTASAIITSKDLPASDWSSPGTCFSTEQRLLVG